MGIPPFSCCTGWYTHTPLNFTLLHLSYPAGMPPFSCFTGCMHTPLNFTLLHCKRVLEVIRWESLPFCCCTGTHIPLSTRLSSMTNVFSSRTVETPSLCHTHIPLSSLVHYFLQDNRLLETTGSTPLLLWWYTFLSTLRSYKTRVVDSFRWELHPFHCCTGTQTSLSPYSPT